MGFGKENTLEKNQIISQMVVEYFCMILGQDLNQNGKMEKEMANVSTLHQKEIFLSQNIKMGN